jgi:3'-phosphoadenosine 5'-phosphosulfate sulfotransferase (PAPS reductase)/FAD synthetase
MDLSAELEIITNAANYYNLDAVYSLFSGGSDSLCATYIASHHPLFKGVVHIDTGIGIPEVQEYVKETCDRFKWNLRIYEAMKYTTAKGELKPQDYNELVKSMGFPGPAGHRIMYTRLKERPLRQAYRELKILHKKLAWSTGIRMNESARRSAHFKNAAQKGGFDKHQSRIWINPILFWDKDRKHELISDKNLPVNPVYQHLCKSGECLCGAFAKPGELLELQIHYPEVYKRLNNLYLEIKNDYPWNWEQEPNKEFIKQRQSERGGQMQLEFFSPTCFSCQFHEEAIAN